MAIKKIYIISHFFGRGEEPAGKVLQTILIKNYGTLPNHLLKFFFGEGLNA